MNEEMSAIFETLAKENPEKKTKEVREKEKEQEKEEKKPPKSHAPWYDISKDTGTAQYTLKDGHWVRVQNAKAYPTYSAPSRSSTYSSSYRASGASYKPSSGNNIKLVVVGDGAVGKVKNNGHLIFF